MKLPMAWVVLCIPRRRANLWWLTVFEVGKNCFGLRFCYPRRRRGVGLLDGLQASEVLQQTARCIGSYARDIEQFGGAVTHLPAFTVERYGESMSLVANHLDQVEHRIVVVETTGSFSCP